MAKINTKTNALRMLDANKIPYEIHAYDAPDGFLDGVSVAKATGMDVPRVFKTLVTQGAQSYYICVIPVACELDLKKAAKHFGEKKIQMIRAGDITKVTGYVKGGCSPVGMVKLFPTCIDESVLPFDHIVVSAGKVGLQMEVPVSALCRLIRATTADLITRL